MKQPRPFTIVARDPDADWRWDVLTVSATTKTEAKEAAREILAAEHREHWPLSFATKKVA